MKERADLLYLRHMLDAIGRIESYLGGVDEGSFLANSEKQDAVVMGDTFFLWFPAFLRAFRARESSILASRLCQRPS